MKNIVAAIILLIALFSATKAQTTTFAYQGNLSISGSPANGTFPMQFSLWDTIAGGLQIGSTSFQNVVVTNGVFSVYLDYGAAAFTGADRFLQVTANLNTFPRIQLTSSPYAIRARSVGPITDASLNPIISVTNTEPGITNPSPTNLPPSGLLGRSSSPSDTTAGLIGISDSDDGIGVVGMTSTSTIFSNSSTAFLAMANTGSKLFVGVNIASPGTSKFSVDASGNVSASGNLNVDGPTNNIQGNLNVQGSSNVGSPGVPRNLTVAGNLFVSGTKSSVAKLRDGTSVVLYAVESPENWFEDFGTIRLHNGRAWIAIDQKFAQTINPTLPYKVFLTPNGNCRGLYIARKTATGFEVREIARGRSNVEIDFRIVAKRLHFEKERLELVPTMTDSNTK